MVKSVTIPKRTEYGISYYGIPRKTEIRMMEIRRNTEFRILIPAKFQKKLGIHTSSFFQLLQYSSLDVSSGRIRIELGEGEEITNPRELHDQNQGRN